ncbi:MAG TPA: hypothetical protein VH208_11795 [Myxococcaceae bacterium]|jgi:hypothetical protein|nr:hypothetical protein [Myxococcaceae bacterium]
MLSMKSVASALVLVASAADTAVPVLVAPALALAVSTVVHAGPSSQIHRQQVAPQSILAANGQARVHAG